MPLRRFGFAMLGFGPVGVVVTAVVAIVAPTAASARPVEPVVRAAPMHAGAGSTTSAPTTTTAAAPAVTVPLAIDATLEHAVRRAMAPSGARDWSVVADVGGVGRVVAIRPGLAMRPASNQKLFTATAALGQGPGRRLLTSVAVDGAPVGGVVAGDLVVRTGADPSLTQTDLAGLAAQVRAAGVRTVTGALRIDIGDLPLERTRRGWQQGFVPDELGPLSPFPVDEDAWRADPAYLLHPTRSNALLFRRILGAAGVDVLGGVQIRRDATASVVLARHESLTVRRLLGHTLRVSDNFAAETFLSLAGGLPATDAVVSKAGITDTSISTDGSGLSYADRETTRGELTLLHYTDAHRQQLGLRSLLPVACRSGTLRHRLCHTIAAGRVLAKTGTLSHTTALTGWTKDAKLRPVTFSVITMGTRNVFKAEDATDQVVLLLRRYAG
jgi:D-alanyl-D-alanine carboxypeptidase/D-alanyl-D-alanine-endopeptidase (penicillin-binding protein 4)